MVKNGLLCLFFTKKVLPLSSQKALGTLDEWLSQWSAKPCTAVRIRQVPQKEFLRELLFFVFIVPVLFDNSFLLGYFRVLKDPKDLKGLNHKPRKLYLRQFSTLNYCN